MKQKLASGSRLAAALGLAMTALLVTLTLTTASQAAAPVEKDSSPGQSMAIVTTQIDYTDATTDTAYAQTRSPEKLALITQTGILTVTGVAWYGDARPSFPPDPVLDPITNTSHSGTYYVTWQSVPSAINYVLQESADPDFLTITDLGGSDGTAGSLHFKYLTGQAPGTYYYRLKANNLDGESRWSNVQSVFVDHTAQMSDISLPSFVGLMSPTQFDHTFITAAITVQVRIDDSILWFDTVAAADQTWWTWTGGVPIPVTDYGQHTIQVRAQNSLGELGPTDVITVLIDTLAPTTAIGNLTNGQRINGQYVVTGTASNDGSGIAKVEISFDGGATWDTATGTTSWAYLWAPTGGEKTYTVTARAIDGVGNVGANAANVTVLAGQSKIFLPIVIQRWPPVPYAPTLNAISNSDQNGDYTVSWNAADLATTYLLQEDDNSVFSSPTEYDAGTALSKAFTSKAAGTYYYRVRGANSYGSGEWSNVQSTIVVPPGYIEDFNPCTSNCWSVYDKSLFSAGYSDGEYRLKIKLDANGANNYQMAVMKTPYSNPYTNYDITVKHRFNKASDQEVDPVNGKAGIMFGASDDYDTVYIFEWNFQGEWAVFKYSDLSFPADWSWPLDRSDDIRWWAASSAIKKGYKNNEFTIKVRGVNVELWANGTELDSFNISSLSGRTRRSGLSTGSWEFTPVDSRFDYFYLVPK